MSADVKPEDQSKPNAPIADHIASLAQAQADPQRALAVAFDAMLLHMKNIVGEVRSANLRSDNTGIRDALTAYDTALENLKVGAPAIAAAVFSHTTFSNATIKHDAADKESTDRRMNPNPNPAIHATENVRDPMTNTEKQASNVINRENDSAKDREDAAERERDTGGKRHIMGQHGESKDASKLNMDPNKSNPNDFRKPAGAPDKGPNPDKKR